IPNGGKNTSFDISFVDTATQNYVLGDRTNKGVDVIDTSTNTVPRIAGQGLFKGVVLVKGVANKHVSGPRGVLIVNSQEDLARRRRQHAQVFIPRQREPFGPSRYLCRRCRQRTSLTGTDESRRDVLRLERLYRVRGEQRGQSAVHHRRRRLHP